MCNNFKTFLYQIDLLGITPQLKIFNNTSYKSILTAFLSIIILIISFAFSLYSLIDYCKFDNPIVVYYKINDEINNRTISLKDNLFIFGLIDKSTLKIVNKSDGFYKALHKVVYYNGTFKYTEINLESCEFGKNINNKYKKFYDKIKIIQTFNYNVKDFYCISPKYENLTISYIPNIGESSLLLNTIINNNSNIIPEKIQSFIFIETNNIDHNNKSNPINYYIEPHVTSPYSSSKFSSTDFILQYIKYESDTGLFFKNYEIFDGKYFFGLEYDKTIVEDLNTKNIGIGSIMIEMNKFYDYYKRSYTKIPTLLAEITTIINILFTIGNQISYFLLHKKMSKDIVKMLINDSIKNENNKKKISNHLNKNNHDLFIDNFKNNIYSDKTEIKEKMNLSIEKIDEKNNISSKKKNFNKNAIIIKKLSYWNIIKSFFCFKDKRNQLINICYNLINKDISIERILKKLYKIDDIYYLPHKNPKQKDNYKNNINKKKKFKEINKILYEINDEMKIKINNDDHKT